MKVKLLVKDIEEAIDKFLRWWHAQTSSPIMSSDTIKNIRSYSTSFELLTIKLLAIGCLNCYTYPIVTIFAAAKIIEINDLTRAAYRHDSSRSRENQIHFAKELDRDLLRQQYGFDDDEMSILDI